MHILQFIFWNSADAFNAFLDVDFDVDEGWETAINIT